jgi:hypothetical protein
LSLCARGNASFRLENPGLTPRRAKCDFLSVQLRRRLEIAQPIYKLFMGRFSEAWYDLSQEEQNRLLAKLNEALEKVGGKRQILCDSSWSSDQWSFAGIEEFPNIEAVQKFTAALKELNWFRYCESTNVLGTKLES